ncbi:hypothetical protein CC2G_006282 [Coprinopsis cinerea AmutBmut pab1-1]|nr:hypothetical protein CC2G_006282 [Coprinopsis cinerea AmutBmut pab1-1]
MQLRLSRLIMGARPTNFGAIGPPFTKMKESLIIPPYVTLPVSFSPFPMPWAIQSQSHSVEVPRTTRAGGLNESAITGNLKRKGAHRPLRVTSPTSKYSKYNSSPFLLRTNLLGIRMGLTRDTTRTQ